MTMKMNPTITDASRLNFVNHHAYEHAVTSSCVHRDGWTAREFCGLNSASSGITLLDRTFQEEWGMHACC